jgi:hypothetical protein
VSELRSRLLLSAALAVALGGCAIMPNVSATDFSMFKGSDPLHSDEYNYFYRRDQKLTGAVVPTDLVGPDGRCAYNEAPAPAVAPSPAPPAGASEPVAHAPAPAADPINPRSNQALYFTAGPEAGGGASAGSNAMPPQVRNGPSGIALQMTECQVVAVAGYTDRVEIGTNARGQRTVTLAYMTGERPGIYRFTAGRLTSMERVEEPPQPKKPKKPARSAKAKKVTPAQ